MALAVVSVALAVHGVRAAAAHVIACRTRYGGTAGKRPADLDRACDEATRLYPHNYYFCAWTAQRAFDAGAFDTARKWCDRGLAMNSFKRRLNVLKAELLLRDSPRDAAAWWARYLEWDFWDPYNQYLAVYFHAAAGEWDAARASLRWTRHSDYYSAAEDAFREAWLKEMAAP